MTLISQDHRSNPHNKFDLPISKAAPTHFDQPRGLDKGVVEWSLVEKKKKLNNPVWICKILIV